MDAEPLVPRVFSWNSPTEVPVLEVRPEGAPGVEKRRKFSGHQASIKDSFSFEEGPRKDSFNNRDLIKKPVGRCVSPEDLEVAELGDTDRGSEVVAMSNGGLLDIVGDEGPKAIDVDGEMVELVVEAVEVVHADLAEVPGMVLVGEDAVVVHASDVTAATRVPPVLLEAGRHRRRCRSPSFILHSSS